MKNNFPLTVDLSNHRSYLQRFGVFSNDSRKAIYLECLQTPLNYQHFSEISRKFAQSLPEHTLDKQTTCIVGWLSSAYSDLRIQWLPGVVYPFVKLFPKDSLTQFEISLTYLANWCAPWFLDYPAPSKQVLDIISSNLPELDTHLRSTGHSLGSLLWPMFLVSFTDVLNKSDWLKVLDHAVVQPERPWLLLAIVIELVRYLEPDLLTAKSLERMHSLLRKERKVQIREIIKYGLELAKVKEATFKQIYRGTKFPLPKGRYPILQFINKEARIRSIVQQQQQSINKKLEQEVEDLQKQLRQKNVQLRTLTNNHVDNFEQKLQLAMRNHLKVVSDTNHRKLEALREVQQDLRQWVSSNQKYREEQSNRISEYVRKRALLQHAIVQAKTETEATKQIEINALHRLKSVINQKQQQQKQIFRQLHKELHNVEV